MNEGEIFDCAHTVIDAFEPTLLYGLPYVSRSVVFAAMAGEAKSQLLA
jgi:hypothetical protein